ncbi:MAG: hypothetical protein AMXMBFR13_35750 [Phycisphaerae bacterium]
MEWTMRKTSLVFGRGFTLIEVLVVVAIIGLLVSILIPSLSKAREQARKAACQSNLHQVMIGFFGYTSRLGEYVPRAAGHELGGKTGRVGLVDPWLPAMMFGGGLPADQRPLNREIGKAYDLFRCPADKGEPLWWFDTEGYQATSTAFDLYGSSYFYASGYNRMIGVIEPMGLAKLVGVEFAYKRFQASMLPNGESVKVSFYPRPAKKVVVGDVPIYRTMPGVIAPNRRAQWHRQDARDLWANAAFLDGHAEFVKVFPYDGTRYQGTSTSPDPGNPYY